MWFFKPNVAKLEAKRDAMGLVRALKDRRFEVRSLAANALMRLGSGAVEPLTVALQDSDARVRRSASKTLGEIMDLRAVEPLIGALQDSDGEVRRSAVEALGKIGDARAVGPLMGALEDSTHYVCRITESVLKGFGSSAVGSLIGVLQDERHARTAEITLASLLERTSINTVRTEYLDRIAKLNDFCMQVNFSNQGAAKYYTKIDCTEVKQLARQELTRRGLEA